MVRAVPTAPRPEGLAGRREASALGRKSNTLQKLDFAKLLKLVSRLCKNLHFCESRAKRRACCDEQSRAALSDFLRRGDAFCTRYRRARKAPAKPARRVAERGFLPLLDNIETIRMKKCKKNAQFFPWLSQKTRVKRPKNVKIF